MNEHRPDADRREPEDAPPVAIAHAFDDEEGPRSVTVFPAHRADVTTRWLTVDVEHAVDPREVA